MDEKKRKRHVESIDLATGLRKKDHFHTVKDREPTVCKNCGGIGNIVNNAGRYKKYIQCSFCLGEGEIWE